MTVASSLPALRLHRQRLLLAATGAFALDLATKVLASATLDDRSVHVVGPLQLRLVHNPGIAFSLGDRAPAALILVLTGAVALVLGFSAWRGQFGSAVAAGLVLGGAAANLVDRMEAGTVVDMFDVGWWPTFNVADIGITLGVGLLLLTAWAGHDGPTERRPVP